MEKVDSIQKIERAKMYAIGRHTAKNCYYGDKYPYEYHLRMVVDEALEELEPTGSVERFVFGEITDLQKIFTYSEEDTDLIVACWCHDVQEDTCETYTDIKSIIGEDAADIVYAVSNELGKNRKERAERTYPKIRADVRAIFVKLCDRIANTTFSKTSGSSMYDKYRKEYPGFKEALYTEDPKVAGLWAKLDMINL